MKKAYKRVYKSLHEGEGHLTMIIALFTLAFFILTILGVIPIPETAGQQNRITGGARLASADTLQTEKSFSKDIKSKLNKFKPEQVIEFKMPSLYVKEDNVRTHFQSISVGDFFQSMPVDEFVNLIEKFNCKLISYSYRKNVGLFRIGRLKGEK